MQRYALNADFDSSHTFGAFFNNHYRRTADAKKSPNFDRTPNRRSRMTIAQRPTGNASATIHLAYNGFYFISFADSFLSHYILPLIAH
jgi:hypothetical protein